jgi:hypothetical protein
MGWLLKRPLKAQADHLSRSRQHLDRGIALIIKSTYQRPRLAAALPMRVASSPAFAFDQKFVAVTPPAWQSRDDLRCLSNRPRGSIRKRAADASDMCVDHNCDAIGAGSASAHNFHR